MNRCQRAILAPLLAVVAMVLGFGEKASAAFNAEAQNPHYGNFLLWEAEASGFARLQPADPMRGNGKWVYDSALGVPVYVRQNPWTMFDPLGLQGGPGQGRGRGGKPANWDANGGWAGFGKSIGASVVSGLGRGVNGTAHGVVQTANLVDVGIRESANALGANISTDGAYARLEGTTNNLNSYNGEIRGAQEAIFGAEVNTALEGVAEMAAPDGAAFVKGGAMVLKGAAKLLSKSDEAASLGAKSARETVEAANGGGATWNNGWRTANGKFASPNGAGRSGAAAEQSVWDAVNQKPGWSVIEGQVGVRNASDQLRYYDGAAVSPRGRVIGLETKSGTATKTPAQRAFDSGVNTQNPAIGVGQNQGLEVGRALEIRR